MMGMGDEGGLRASARKTDTANQDKAGFRIQCFKHRNLKSMNGLEQNFVANTSLEGITYHGSHEPKRGTRFTG